MSESFKVEPDAVDTFAASLRTLAEAAATELAKVAQVYRTTDKARADELDRTYPAGGQG